MLFLKRRKVTKKFLGKGKLDIIICDKKNPNIEKYSTIIKD
jgi:hypothetical protein